MLSKTMAALGQRERRINPNVLGSASPYECENLIVAMEDSTFHLHFSVNHTTARWTVWGPRQIQTNIIHVSLPPDHITYSMSGPGEIFNASAASKNTGREAVPGIKANSIFSM
jgi:hypothetical protein